MIMTNKEVNSLVQPLKTLFSEKFDVDFYQREYVWRKKQLEDLINDLSNEFLRNWKQNHITINVRGYDPYYMGGVVISIKTKGRNAIIDGQQRITTFTLLLIYLSRYYGNIPGFPKAEVDQLIYSDDFGSKRFNLEIEERKECMLSLYESGEYILKDKDSISVQNLVNRFNDISDCWNDDIKEDNAAHFAYWIKEKVMFSKVWTTSDDFAYIIFETMNDRGLSLTQVEMLRSYLLANIEESNRDRAMKDFDDVVKILLDINLHSKSKAEFEFFKVYFRGHYAQNLSSNNPSSDFVKIGNEFHRWVSDNNLSLNLKRSNDYEDFLSRIHYYAGVYRKIYDLIYERNEKDYLYLIVNADYGFTLQPALILASIDYLDDDETVFEKIQIVTKYLTRILTWRVWNHVVISQSSLESTVYELCKTIRKQPVDIIKETFKKEPVKLPELENAPTLNQQNRNKLRVLLALITEIVAVNSGEPDYMLNKNDIEIEHIWSNHFEEHEDEFSDKTEFAIARNNIGDLLLLPKGFNAAYGADPYHKKVVHYYEQNILAQSLNKNKYDRNPGFMKFIEESKMAFVHYDEFKRSSITQRAELYKSILEWNWK
jgi:uncharacterized protein with ParB-like and HNH nuclease domain